MSITNQVVQGHQVSLSRKLYATPCLHAYGNVAKLTQGGVSTTRSDSGNNNMRPSFAPDTNNSPKKRR